MKVAGKLAWMVPLAFAFAIAPGCGGIVVVDRDGDGGDGGGGEGGSTTITLTFTISGNPGGCDVIECEKDVGSCSCRTACVGPDLRAECEVKDDGTVVCECHYNGGYMGLCAHFNNSVCGLPDGCCLDYFAK